MTDLARAWHATGLAAIGYALLGRARAAGELPDGWAQPRRIDRDELRKLVLLLVGDEQGEKQFFELLQGGLVASAYSRGEVVRALSAAGVSPRRVFGDIIPKADLGPGIVLDFVRENLADVSQALNLPDGYEDALRLGLARRRRLMFNPFRS